MAFKKVKGKSLLKRFPKAASTTFTSGFLVEPNGSGVIIPATAAPDSILGIVVESVASTDSDFADNTMLGVELCSDQDELEADVTGTLTTAMVGETRDIDSTGQYVDAAGTSNQRVKITKFISASKCLCKLLPQAQG